MKRLILAALLGGIPLLAHSTEIIVPYFLSASDPDRQSFVRVIWPYPVDGDFTQTHGATIRAYDDAGNRYPPIEIELPPFEGTSGVFGLAFNSDDLEFGNTRKHMPYGTGAGEGDWWLRITSDQDIVVQSFIRMSDGFLTSMHGVLPKVSNGREKNAYLANTFNPAYNANNVSSLRIINTSNKRLTAKTVGAVDVDNSVNTPLDYGISIKSYQAIKLTAQTLEENAHPNNGWSEKRGKRRIEFWSDGDPLLEHIVVMHIMESPSGHLTNLSTQMGFDSWQRPWPRDD